MSLDDFDAVVVIRSAGENTLKLCNEIIAKEINHKLIRIIECVPFEKAIEESFKIGIKSGRKWLITVDADVLIKTGSINKLIKIGEGLPEDVFQFEGMLYDGLLLKYRQGGIKVYRSSLLNKAIKLIPEPGTQIRPETYTQDQMAKLGYKRLRVDEVVGIHDFGQHPKDIYRKAFVHARKFKNEVTGLFPLWKHLEKQGNTEYLFAIDGAKKGLNYSKTIYLHKDKLDAITNIKIESNLTSLNINEDFVKNILDKNKYYPDSNKILEFIVNLNKFGFIPTFKWFINRTKFKISKYFDN